MNAHDEFNKWWETVGQYCWEDVEKEAFNAGYGAAIKDAVNRGTGFVCVKDDKAKHIPFNEVVQPPLPEDG